MKRNLKNKIEELLMEDDLYGILSMKSGKSSKRDTGEVRHPLKYYSLLKSIRYQSLAHSEKDLLQKQIANSISRYQYKRNLLRWSSIAASLIFIFGSLWYYQNNSTPEIVSFAKQLNVVNPEDNTLLLLGNEREIQITEKESNIQYTQTGKNIRVNVNKKIDQELEGTKAVYNTVVVPYGKRTQITLSEGTKIWLNSGSKLVYPKLFSKNKREVYLEGEAIFDVTHLEDADFYVCTNDFTVKVLGTVFNVSSYPGDKYSSAVLERGKIEITSRNLVFKDKLNIEPGTMAVFDPDQKSFKQEKVNPNDYLSWRSGYYVLDHEGLVSILKKISRYYNVEFIINDENIVSDTFSGKLDFKNTPEEVLKIIAEISEFTFQAENGKIIINP